MPPSLFPAKQNHGSPNRGGTHVCEHTHTPRSHVHTHPTSCTWRRMCLKTSLGVRRGSPSLRGRKLYCSMKRTDRFNGRPPSGQEVLRVCLRRRGSLQTAGKGEPGGPLHEVPCGQHRGHDLRHFPRASSRSGNDKRAKMTCDRHTHRQGRTRSGP